MRILAALAALVFTLVPAMAQERIGTADLETVSRRGAELYAFDQAAWHTTDSMVAKALPRERMEAIRGWIGEPRGGALTVTYYGIAGTKRYAIYAADYAGGKVTGDRVIEGQDTPLSPVGERMAAALETARELSFDACVEQPFNTVVMPPEADGTIPVYLLTPMIKQDAYPFGGHHEVDVGADGKVRATRDFSKSCFPMERSTKAVMAMITHLLDPHPTELHVYLSLWMGTPIVVATPGDTAWMVTGSKIEPFELKPAAKKR